MSAGITISLFWAFLSITSIIQQKKKVEKIPIRTFMIIHVFDIICVSLYSDENIIHLIWCFYSSFTVKIMWYGVQDLIGWQLWLVAWFIWGGETCCGNRVSNVEPASVNKLCKHKNTHHFQTQFMQCSAWQALLRMLSPSLSLALSHTKCAK